MNRNRMLVLAIVALILSGGVTYLVYHVMQSRLQPAQVTSKVVVASRRLGLGSRITNDDVKLVDWPKSALLEGSFDSIANVVDRGTMTQIQTNEPILESKLAPKEAGVGITAVIPEGMRALTIQVNSIIGVSGFVVPGSRVDLILTAVPPQDVKGAKGVEMGSKIILENLEVLAAGQNAQRDVDGKPQTVQDVTLLLTPDQAQRVALATGDGRIQLALRSPMDKVAANPDLVIRSSLYLGPTMENRDATARAKTLPEKPEVKRPAASAKKESRPKVAAQAKIKEPVIAAPLPLPQKTVIEVELIQGIKRTKDRFEEANPESNQNSTQPDGKKLQ
jgi:pilus assembly protein CpaB